MFVQFGAQDFGYDIPTLILVLPYIYQYGDIDIITISKCQTCCISFVVIMHLNLSSHERIS